MKPLTIDEEIKREQALRDVLEYKIPLMWIQDCLANLVELPKVIDMRLWCEENCEESWYMHLALERQWYPEFWFESRWDANKFMRKWIKKDTE
jgi:hypothetical protein